MMQQFGRGLVIEPFLATVVLAGGILRRTANAEQKSRWLAPLIEGELQAALAFAEPQGRFNPGDIATTGSAASTMVEKASKAAAPASSLMASSPCNRVLLYNRSV